MACVGDARFCPPKRHLVGDGRYSRPRHSNPGISGVPDTAQVARQEAPDGPRVQQVTFGLYLILVLLGAVGMSAALVALVLWLAGYYSEE